MTAKHLGGHANKTWIDAGALSFLQTRFGIKTMLDIGCGPGGMKSVAEKLAIAWQGVDGDSAVASRGTVVHDFTTGPVPDLASYDLAWSVEFLEHVAEKHQQNYMAAFERCKFVACTAAPPGWKGHHHVNCRPQAYWIDVFSAAGFRYDAQITREMVAASTMRKRKGRSFMSISGMFFVRRDQWCHSVHQS